MRKIITILMMTLMFAFCVSSVNAKTVETGTNSVHYKQAGDTYIIRLDKGQEIMSTLKQFCVDHKIQAGIIQGIGAGENLNIGFFNTKSKQYEVKNIKECVEITSLLGNITIRNNEPFVHLHITTADSFHSVSGGHLLSGEIALTGEIFLIPLNTKLKRIPAPEMGINVFDIE